jgi:hypothetical protein
MPGLAGDKGFIGSWGLKDESETHALLDFGKKVGVENPDVVNPLTFVFSDKE